MIWLLAAVLIPIAAIAMLFFSMADDFWQLIRFKLDLSRLFGDLIHVLVIIVVAFLAEAFVLFHLVTMFL